MDCINFVDVCSIISYESERYTSEPGTECPPQLQWEARQPSNRSEENNSVWNSQHAARENGDFQTSARSNELPNLIPIAY
ncbi:hypothetical protein N7491_001466 [Penicillium cf. griseofulvum]|uniref:Uncharacterized protein n=1 Tax=Penicillium cf. griseofulvum TaxID=2972120 RepID=A0A9W9JGX0_9EURO|nr:hypothetical protein N7472_006597 [Penicillium cf. griseofulvum]KAJ5445384.1 hypothetical protein N7491_001466 [Penicillium cf. griseofulvum]KAJ5447103.1 hypothetical protein N7445_001924 [Penicillium cf. griseofulvum]